MKKKEVGQKAKQYLKDAEILIEAKRNDGAAYLLGYVIELSLKKTICKSLNWNEYPPGKWPDYKTFKSHDLNILLSLSGKESKIRKNLLAEWSIVSTWNPEILRYTFKPISKNDIVIMYNSVRNILKVL